ncbi:DUF6890 family protein [Pseudodesulfovibrio sp. S3-i]
MALHWKWFGNRPVSDDSLGQALFLEKDHWEKMSVAVTNGIAKAFGK